MRLVNNFAGLAAIAGLSVMVTACGAPSGTQPASAAPSRRGPANHRATADRAHCATARGHRGTRTDGRRPANPGR